MYLVHCIEEGLGDFSREAPDHLDLILVREYRRDQRDALVCGEGTLDQLFPGWKSTAHREPVKLAKA